MAVKWFFLLLAATLASIWLHELAHGLSAYLAGFAVSTGFNRVGDAGKKPSQPDFRRRHSTYRNPWDLGPAVTLTAAVIFTALLFANQHLAATSLLGALALANSSLRLLPMLMAFGGLLFGGNLGREDETEQAHLLQQITGVRGLHLVLPAISLLISGLCTFINIRLLAQTAAPEIGGFWAATAMGLAAAIAASFWLDEHFRIDWIPPCSGRKNGADSDEGCV